MEIAEAVPGIGYAYYEGAWDRLPDFAAGKPEKEGVLENFSFSPRNRDEHFGFMYSGFVRVPVDGVYTFFTDSDDGSRLYIGDELVVDNDGLHGMLEKGGAIALGAGLHPIRVLFFDKTGGDGLKVSYSGPGVEKKPIPVEALYRSAK